MGFGGDCNKVDVNECPATGQSAKHSPMALVTTCRMIRHEFTPVMRQYIPLRLNIGLPSQPPRPNAEILPYMRLVEVTINITEPVDVLGPLCKELPILRSLEKPEMCHICLNCCSREYSSSLRIEKLPSTLLKDLGPMFERFRTVVFSTMHSCFGFHRSPAPGPPPFSSQITHQAMMDAVCRGFCTFYGEGIWSESFVGGEMTERLVFGTREL